VGRLRCGAIVKNAVTVVLTAQQAFQAAGYYRLPCAAKLRAAAIAIVVFPVPPLPKNVKIKAISFLVVASCLLFDVQY
jgi:hypothetical protein